MGNRQWGHRTATAGNAQWAMGPQHRQRQDLHAEWLCRSPLPFALCLPFSRLPIAYCPLPIALRLELHVSDLFVGLDGPLRHLHSDAQGEVGLLHGDDGLVEVLGVTGGDALGRQVGVLLEAVDRVQGLPEQVDAGSLTGWS